MTIEITELQGDGIGPELAESIHAIADSLPADIKFIPVDWSLENREAKGDDVIDEAEASMRATKLAIKYPTETKKSSPDAQIRRRCDFSVIYRPAISIKGIESNFKENVNLHIVRVASGGAYDDSGQLVGADSAVSLRMVERRPCAQAANFAFNLARTKGAAYGDERNYSVTSSSKHTIQRVTDGLFESAVAEVGKNHTDVEHRVELFDALLAKIIMDPSEFEVVLVLNEYGDFLSDMASGLVGSLGTGASGNYSFDADNDVDIAMFDPAGGTALDIAGKNVANPSAAMLAFGMLLDHVDRYDLGHGLRLSLLDALERGDATRDLGGKLNTSEFTEIVIDNIADYI